MAAMVYPFPAFSFMCVFLFKVNLLWKSVFWLMASPTLLPVTTTIYKLIASIFSLCSYFWWLSPPLRIMGNKHLIGVYFLSFINKSVVHFLLVQVAIAFTICKLVKSHFQKTLCHFLTVKYSELPPLTLCITAVIHVTYMMYVCIINGVILFFE